MTKVTDSALVGNSSPFRAVLEQVNVVAPADCTVLIHRKGTRRPGDP